MGRPCSVCAHPDRAAIDRALVSGTPRTALASRHGLSEPAVRRHEDTHLPERLSKAAEAAEIAEADDLLGQVRTLQHRALGILDQAEDAGDLRTALGAIREARGNLELLAKLLGELNEGTTVNVLVSPEWLQVRTIILQALDPFPDARLALADAMEAHAGD